MSIDLRHLRGVSVRCSDSADGVVGLATTRIQMFIRLGIEPGRASRTIERMKPSRARLKIVAWRFGLYLDIVSMKKCMLG